MRTIAISLVTICIWFSSNAAFAQAIETPDFTVTAQSINTLIRNHHYNPEELNKPAYLEMEKAVTELGQTAENAQAFLEAFNALWRKGPFSHVNLAQARGTAEEMAAFLDTLNVGGGGAVLSWQNKTAILTVNTMMGLDTIEEIEAAYDEIAEKGADQLIIDLRANNGGAFAVRPLVGHLLKEPYDAGSFVSRLWFSEMGREPTFADAQEVDPWDGWSIRAFWADAVSKRIIRIRFEPMKPLYSGPVYVLTSGRTASAAEMATDAMKGSERVKVIGQRTAGQMLSQMPFDVPGGFHLFLPIADYYSYKGGRIEGEGVEPHIETAPSDALDKALSH